MLIGLTGQLQAGKDTVADILVKDYGFEKRGFSDALYQSVCELFDIDLETALRFKTDGTKVVIADSQFPMVSKGVFTWREFLQRYGTESHRNVFGKDFWVEYLLKDLDLTKNIVIRDVRFVNEAFGIKMLNGDIWKINREGYEGDSHESEAALAAEYIRFNIYNDGTIADLEQTIDHLLHDEYRWH